MEEVLIVTNECFQFLCNDLLHLKYWLGRNSFSLQNILQLTSNEEFCPKKCVLTVGRINYKDVLSCNVVNLPPRARHLVLMGMTLYLMADLS